MAHILLIDDDDPVRTMLREMLIHHGHTVAEARDGQAGLALFARSGADLVITDIVMPNKEGLEVLLELRKVRPPVKMIAISGGGPVSAAEYLKIAAIVGAARVFTKPFSLPALIVTIDELLAGDVARASPFKPNAES